MSDIVFGYNMVMEIKIDGIYYPVGCAVSCSFEFTNEIIGKTDKNAGLFRKKRVRISDCSASVQGLTTLKNNSTISVMYFLQEGIRRSEQDLRFKFIDESNYMWQIQGFFLVESIPLTADVNEFSEFDINFQGTGGISQGVPGEDSGETPSGIPGDVIFDWWPCVAGESTITGPGHFGRSFAGHEVIEVDREGTQHEEVAGTPGDMEYAYDLTTISFDTNNLFNDGERVYVLWQIYSDES